MKWIKSEDKLPPEGKYVLGRHNRGTWHDGSDQANVNCVVVKLIRGISMEEREKMRIKLPPRANIYKPEDEHSNNEKPYYWSSFGPDSFFGQTVTHWLPIPEVE